MEYSGSNTSADERKSGLIRAMETVSFASARYNSGIAALLVAQRSYSLGSALIFALCGGIGATLALASFASLQKEVDLNRCPRAFRGVPIQLITAGLMAMALVGYYGLYFGE